jgi:asparagine synthase (glutamine-hydrolysing)
MCGICGYVGCNRPELLEQMCSVMTHRGPDDFGIWFDLKQNVGLGHRRLSIIDLSSAGHQPMSNADGTIWLSYNGEIYNFQEYRKLLVEKGYKFRGNSDTEVLLYLYEEFGLDFLNKLNGIFALAIWNTKRKELLLVRDHAGIKPLYYWQDNSRLYFASEIKALLRIPEIPRELNENAVPAYLTFLWVPGEQTMLKSVKKIEPGHFLVWKNGRLRVEKWFTLTYSPDKSVSEEQWIERVRDTFMRTTQRQMISDASLGAFLSGGLDSSSIVSCMRNVFPEREINCYTISHKQEELAREGIVHDFPYAEKVAKSFNVNLKSRVINKDILKLLPKMVYHLDEPDADPAAILTYIIAEMAREDGVKVLLSGTGGDEIFFGYRSHQAYRQYEYLKWVPDFLLSSLLSAATATATLMRGTQSALARRTRKFRNGLLQQGLAKHIALADWSDPQTRLNIVTDEFSQALREDQYINSCMKKYFDNFTGTGELNRHSYVLTQTFLAAHNFLYNDKAAMAASIEVRVPFMDIELMKLTACIPEHYKMKGTKLKYLFNKAMQPYLPREVLCRKKTGFYVPLRQWLADGLDDAMCELLSPARLKARGIFKSDEIQNMLKENRENKADHGYLIYALMCLELWQQTFIDQPGVEVEM